MGKKNESGKPYANSMGHGARCFLPLTGLWIYAYTEALESEKLGILIGFFVSVAILMLLPKMGVIMDENGYYEKWLLKERRYAWSDVVRAGVVKIEGSGDDYNVYIELDFRDGQNARVSYGRAADRCVLYYYGPYDYDDYGGHPA